MTNHLKACWKQYTVAVPGKAPLRWFHLVVEARYTPDYWMHLQAPANCTFGDLDQLLRAIWLECCSHLSAFEFPVQRKRHRRATPGDIAAMVEELVRESQESLSDDDASGDALMGKRLGSKLKPGVVFSHQYDFGTTTELALRVAGEYTAPALRGALKLLARNEPPVVSCSVCAKPATQLCLQCLKMVPWVLWMLAPANTTAARKCLCPDQLSPNRRLRLLRPFRRTLSLAGLG